MEIIGYFLVYLSCLALKQIKWKEGNLIADWFAGVIGDTMGGAVEEMMESIVQYIFPNGSFFFCKNLKKKKKLFEEFSEYIRNLTTDELRELTVFLNSLDYSLAPIPELVAMTKAIEENPSLYFGKDRQSSNRADIKKIKKLQEKIKIELKKACEKIGKEECAYLNGKDSKEIIRDLFGVEWDEIPESARKMFNLLIDQVYEIKYLGMSTTEQDFIKIIQHMLDDNNEALINTLKPSFNYMDQVREMTGTSFTQVKIDSIAKTNPYCYFRLECPHCKASGRNVYKDSENNVHCRKCGESFSIMSAVRDDEIKQKIDAAYEGISVVHQNLDAVKDSTEKELRTLAEKIVEVEYFEALKESITESINDQSLTISNTVEKFVSESEGNIKEKIDEVVNLILRNDKERRITAEELSNNVTAAITSLDEENKKRQNDMIDLMQQHMKEVGEVKAMVTMMVEQMTNIENLQKTFSFMNSVMNTPAPEIHTAERSCPLCGRWVKFERKPDEKFYVCKHCNCYIDMDRMNDPSIPTNALEIEIKKYCDAYFYFKYKGSAVGKNKKTARIHISHADANCLNTNINCSLTEYHLMAETETLIITGNVTLNEHALGLIIGHNNNVKVVVLGDGTGLTVNGDLAAWMPNFGDGSVWRYEKDLFKLSRKNKYN